MIYKEQLTLKIGNMSEKNKLKTCKILTYQNCSFVSDHFCRSALKKKSEFEFKNLCVKLQIAPKTR